MALIQCDECGGEVSDKAESCPDCGAPIAGTVTTQQTSKSHKGREAVGVVVSILGVMLLAGTDQTVLGGSIFFGGAALYIAGRVGGWWEHG